MIVGGGQERALRGGTENVAGIVGLAKAFELAFVHMVEHESHVRGVKQLMVDGLRARLPEVMFNGNSDQDDRLYTVLNVKFPPHPNSGMATFLLDLEGWLVRVEARVPVVRPRDHTCCMPSGAKTLSVPASAFPFRGTRRRQTLTKPWRPWTKSLRLSSWRGDRPCTFGPCWATTFFTG